MSEETEYAGPERRQSMPRLSDEQMEAIADRAYEKATERIYTEIGKGVVKAAVYLIGAGLLTLAAWLGLSEKIR